MNLKSGLRPVTEVLAVVVGYLCGLVCFAFYLAKTGLYFRAVLIALPGTVIGYCTIWFIYWLIEWLILRPNAEAKTATEKQRGMNQKQKICLWVGIIAFVAMALCPPWEATWALEYQYVPFLCRICCYLIFRPPGHTIGYHLIFTPPDGAAVDSARLAIQWVLVSVITAYLILKFRDKKAKSNE